MRGRILLPLLSAVLLLAGCWNRREVNEVAITTAVAIDKEDDQQIRVTLQVLQPAASAGQGTDTTSARSGTFKVTATGQTVFDALRNINLSISRRPEWKHNNAIILSEAVARAGVSGVLDFFLRDYESRLDQWILVARGRASDVMVPRFRLEGNQGAGIRRLNRSAAQTTAKTVQVRLRDFMLNLSGPPAAPMTALIEVAPRSADPQAPGEGTERIRIHGAAVFRGDKLAGFLTDSEARGVQWLRGKVSSSIVVVPCKQGPGQGIGVEVISGRANLRPQWREGKYPTVRAAVQVAAMLGDLMCGEDVSKPEALHELEQRTAKVISGEITRVADRLQKELQADPVGVGLALENAFPAAWKQWQGKWDQIFPQIRIIPEVTVRLEQTGTINGKSLPGGGGGGGGEGGAGESGGK